MTAPNDSEIRMIPVDSITVLNPRVRNKKIFNELVTSIAHLGLKKPITVSARADGSGYDLVCGQGRLEAFVALGQAEIPAMLQSGGGAIVNTASAAGLIGFANLPAYVASKHGVVGLTKSIALEFAQLATGIRMFEVSDMVAGALGIAFGWLLAQPRLPNLLRWLQRRLAPAADNPGSQ